MIAALALLIAAQTVPPDPSAARSDDIVVRAMRKLDDWRGVLVFQNDKPACRVVTSTADADIDAIGCTTMVQCFITTKPQFLALNDRSLSARKRRQMRIDANRDMNECFKTTRLKMMTDLTNRRAASQPAESGK